MMAALAFNELIRLTLEAKFGKDPSTVDSLRRLQKSVN